MCICMLCITVVPLVSAASIGFGVSATRLLIVIRGQMKRSGELRYGLAKFEGGMFVQVMPGASRSSHCGPEWGFRPSACVRMAGPSPDRDVDMLVDSYLEETNRRSVHHDLGVLDQSAEALGSLCALLVVYLLGLSSWIFASCSAGGVGSQVCRGGSRGSHPSQCERLSLWRGSQGA